MYLKREIFTLLFFSIGGNLFLLACYLYLVFSLEEDPVLMGTIFLALFSFLFLPFRNKLVEWIFSGLRKRALLKKKLKVLSSLEKIHSKEDIEGFIQFLYRIFPVRRFLVVLFYPAPVVYLFSPTRKKKRFLSYKVFMGITFYFKRFPKGVYIEDLPPSLQRNFSPLGLKTIVPIATEEEVWGYIGLSRKLPLEELEVLWEIGRYIAFLFYQFQLEESIKKENFLLEDSHITSRVLSQIREKEFSLPNWRFIFPEGVFLYFFPREHEEKDRMFFLLDLFPRKNLFNFLLFLGYFIALSYLSETLRELIRNLQEVLSRVEKNKLYWKGFIGSISREGKMEVFSIKESLLEIYDQGGRKKEVIFSSEVPIGDKNFSSNFSIFPTYMKDKKAFFFRKRGRILLEIRPYEKD